MEILMEIQILLHIWNTKMLEIIFLKVFLNWTFFFSFWHKPRNMWSIITLYLAPFREVWTRSLQSSPPPSPSPKNVKNKAQLIYPYLQLSLRARKHNVLMTIPERALCGPHSKMFIKSSKVSWPFIRKIILYKRLRLCDPIVTNYSKNNSGIQ